MKESYKNKIIELIPNIGWIKRYLSKIRVKRVKGHLIPEADVVSGEQNAARKKSIVDKYMSSMKDYLKPTVTLAHEILGRVQEYKDRLDKDDIFTDMVFCRLAYGFQPDEYLCFGLEKQSMEGRRQWISDLERYVYIYSMNDIKDAQLFNNKARTYEIFGTYYGREAISIRIPKDYDRFSDFTEKHAIFVKKQVFEGCGRSIELVDIKNIGMEKKAYFERLIASGEHIIEEQIQAHDVISALNPSSVNTVRCITFRTRDGICIPFTFMKIGRNGAFVDNGGAGGLLVEIDPETGEFTSDGFDEDMVCYEVHPDTRVRFKGYQLPEWDRVLALCKEISLLTPNVMCIGWDLTYSDKGWIVVEGNGMTQLIGPQIVGKKGTKRKTMEIMRNMDLIVKV